MVISASCDDSALQLKIKFSTHSKHFLSLSNTFSNIFSVAHVLIAGSLIIDIREVALLRNEREMLQAVMNQHVRPTVDSAGMKISRRLTKIATKNAVGKGGGDGSALLRLQRDTYSNTFPLSQSLLVSFPSFQNRVQ